jgi:PilZ domain-containing protein
MPAITFALADHTEHASERRKEPRYDVELHGELRHASRACAVLIADISGSGALVFMESPPAPGTEAQLRIEGFGVLPIRIVYVGEYFCGVAIAQPDQHRDRLLDWLHGEIAAGGPAAAVR